MRHQIIATALHSHRTPRAASWLGVLYFCSLGFAAVGCSGEVDNGVPPGVAVPIPVGTPVGGVPVGVADGVVPPMSAVVPTGGTNPVPGQPVAVPGAQIPVGGTGGSPAAPQIPGAVSPPDPVGGAIVPAAPVALVPALVSTPLARLTNHEYVASLRALLELPSNAVFSDEVIQSLPAEPSEGGVVNNANHQPLSQLHIAAYDRVAAVAADLFLSQLNAQNNGALAELLGCQDLGDAPESTCLLEFGQRLMERAARNAPTEGRVEYISEALTTVVQATSALGISATEFDSRLLQVRSLISVVALSPEFLLMVERGEAGSPSNQLGANDVANRLAFLLSGAPPDELLQAAAADGSVLDSAVRAAQVDRLLSSAEGLERLVQTLIGWLKVPQDGVDAADYDALASFIRTWLVEKRPVSDFYQGLIDVSHLDGNVTREPLGVLGSRAFVAAHTTFPTPSFISRGVFAVQELLCSQLPDGLPVEAFEVESQTAIEVFEQHAMQPCASCHRFFDNYGAVFQQFEPETNLFVPDRAPFGENFELIPLGDVSGTASTVADLSHKLATSEQAAKCITEVVYRLAMRRGLQPEDEALVKAHSGQWLRGGGTLQGLVREIVSSEGFVTFIR